jgi:hypothetical protein
MVSLTTLLCGCIVPYDNGNMQYPVFGGGTSIRIIVPGGAPAAEVGLFNLLGQAAAGQRTTGGQLLGQALADANKQRCVQVDGFTVVSWYAYTEDKNLIWNVDPGVHTVSVLLRDGSTGEVATIGELTVGVPDGQTAYANFR